MAGVVSEMSDQGGLAVPRINGLPYLEKPPLYYGSAWLIGRLAGRLDGGILRLPSALFGVATFALLGWTARRLYGEAVAWVCALLAATCFSLVEVFHRACTDSAALFFAFLCFTVFAESLRPRAEAAARQVLRCDVLLALALALSFYAKNFYTLLVVLPPIAAYLVLRGRVRRLAVLLLLSAGLLALVLAPWCWALYREGGWPYLRTVFLDNTLGRFLDLREWGRALDTPISNAYTAEKQSSPFFYLSAMAYLPFPWTPLVVAALVHSLATKAGSELRLFLKIALVAIPTALTLSASKVDLYLAPVLWVAFLMTGGWLHDLDRLGPAARRLDRVVITANVMLVGLILLAAPLVARHVLGSAAPLWPILPVMAMIAFLALRFRRQPIEGSFLRASCACAAAGYALNVLTLVPVLDQERSCRAFFEDIRPELEGREVCTLSKDDLRLPLIEYYLRRRAVLLDGEADAVERLRGPARVGVLLPASAYPAARPLLADVPHRVIRGTRGKQPFVLVVNP